MARVFRRTPETEKASKYGWSQLVRDAFGKMVRDTSRGLKERQEVSESDLLDLATAGGGMLKVAGTGKLLAGAVKGIERAQRKLPGIMAKMNPQAAKVLKTEVERAIAKRNIALRESFQVPEKEWNKLSDIFWAKFEGRPQRQGDYVPSENIIRLRSRGPMPGTVSHEFTHLRQFQPDPKAVLESGISERTGTRALIGFENTLRRLLQDLGHSPETFYHTASPIERHARAMEDFGKASRVGFGEMFRRALEDELAIAERGARKLGLDRAVRRIWEEAL